MQRNHSAVLLVLVAIAFLIFLMIHSVIKICIIVQLILAINLFNFGREFDTVFGLDHIFD